MYPPLKRHLIASMLSLLLSACSEEAGDGQETGGADALPEYVFAAGEGFSVSLEIVAPTEAIAGEPITVSAKRRTGPWKRVRSAEVPMGVMSFANKPVELEPEVAENVWWETEPPSSARFGTLPGCCWLPRTATFAEPGTYKIWAVTLPGPTKSNVVTVTVRSNK
jgi:hypothetical protein